MTHYSYEFTMAEPTYESARIEFNLGISNADVVLDNVSVMKLAGTPLPTAVPTPTPILVLGDVKALYKCGEVNPSTNQIVAHFNIQNTGTTDVNLNNLALRYWYTKDGSVAEEFHCDYAVLGSASITGAFSSEYVEVGFVPGTGILAPEEETGEIKMRINKTDWSPYDQTNDHSFDATKTNFTEWTHITLHLGTEQIWGVPPGGPSEPVTPEPTDDPELTPQPTDEPTPAVGQLGDVNGDGSIDIVDALLVAQYYVGLNPANFDAAQADTNCDTSVDIVDALLIAQYYVSLITSFC
jgi:hypothetical protein